MRRAREKKSAPYVSAVRETAGIRTYSRALFAISHLSAPINQLIISFRAETRPEVSVFFLRNKEKKGVLVGNTDGSMRRSIHQTRSGKYMINRTDVDMLPLYGRKKMVNRQLFEMVF